MTNKGKSWLIVALAAAGVSMYGYIKNCEGYVKRVKTMLEVQQESENKSEEDPKS